MKTSESIKELAFSLAKAQAEMPNAQMNAVNPFLKNRYADLNSITDAVRETLAAHGLSYVQMPSVPPDGSYGAGIALTTRLMHESGQWLEDTFVMPLSDEKGKSMMQVAGSAISYARRYALASMLGVVADEDADGNQPPRQSKPASKPKAKANGSQPSGKPAPGANNLEDVLAHYGEQDAVSLPTIAQSILDLGHADHIKHANNIVKLHPVVQAIEKPTRATKVTGEQAAAIISWAATRKDEPVEEAQ